MPWTLNRELLLPVNRRIAIAVDLVAGHAPERDALDRLTRLAARYGERPASWVVLGAAGAPPLHFDGDRLTASGPLDADTSYVVVRYVGARLPQWGLSYPTEVAGHVAYVIVVNQERHRRWSWFLPERHLEAQTLIHEYGHLLGLPPFDHGYYVDYPALSDGAHCVNPDCALSKPRWRALLYGLGAHRVRPPLPRGLLRRLPRRHRRRQAAFYFAVSNQAVYLGSVKHFPSAIGNRSLRQRPHAVANPKG